MYSRRLSNYKTKKINKTIGVLSKHTDTLHKLSESCTLPLDLANIHTDCGYPYVGALPELHVAPEECNQDMQEVSSNTPTGIVEFITVDTDKLHTLTQTENMPLVHNQMIEITQTSQQKTSQGAMPRRMHHIQQAISNLHSRKQQAPHH